MSCSVVVSAQPLGPSRVTSDPAATTKSTWSTAGALPNAFRERRQLAQRLAGPWAEVKRNAGGSSGEARRPVTDASGRSG